MGMGLFILSGREHLIQRARVSLLPHNSSLQRLPSAMRQHLLGYGVALLSLVSLIKYQTISTRHEAGSAHAVAPLTLQFRSEGDIESRFR